MKNVVYLLSSTFDYSALLQTEIGFDAGPTFAADYAWPTTTLPELRAAAPDVVIVDHRFQESEIESLQDVIRSMRSIFVLRLCDPYWEYSRHHWWYRFVGSILDRPRVHVMLNYQPAEITALFGSLSRRSRFLFAPYVYRSEFELPIDHSGRKRSLLLSGARQRAMYPLRAQMASAARWWIPLRLRSRKLDHPGYPDIGQQRRHAIVGLRYLEMLATFRFAAVCSSRSRLELLKYREFAYAGVVPVGDMPATLLDCPEDAWIPWRRNVAAMTRTLNSNVDTEKMASRFRHFMRERREVESMREMVTGQLQRLT